MIRKIHLDFHTRPEVRGVGARFDAEAFAATLADAGVNALATPGKCQYGETYFATRLGVPHPGLVRADLFPATVAACTRRGIRVQAYFTLGLDDEAAARHPAWRQRYADGRTAQWGSAHLCFASPYVDTVVIPEVLEMLAACPGLVGFWFDICLYCPGAWFSPAFEAAAQARLGAAAADPEARWRLSRTLIHEACARVEAAIRAKLPDAENYYNSLVNPGELTSYARQPVQEVENPLLFHGPEKMTTHARWLRWRPAPVIGLVSRFQGPWMDPGTLRTPDQLRFDVARTVALGCQPSMGDHRHPDGTLDAEVYRRLGPIYHEVRALEPWLAGLRPAREALLLSPVTRGAATLHSDLPAATWHAARLLEEAACQFDLATDDEPWPPCDLLIWPGVAPVSPALRQRFDAHLAAGGALLELGAGWDTPAAAETARVGNDAAGQVSQRDRQSFVRPALELGLGDWPILCTLPLAPLPAGAGETVLATACDLASDTPPTVGRTVTDPAVLQRGRHLRVAPRLVDEAMAHGAPGPRELLAALLRRLLPQPLVQHDGGESLAVHLHQAASGQVLHLVHWALDRWGAKVNSALHFPRLGPVTLSVTLPAPPVAVSLLPSGQPLPFVYEAGRCRFIVPTCHIWQVIHLRLGQA